MRSLRLLLLGSFAIVIVASLALSAVAAVVLLRDQQVEAAEQRIGRLATPFSASVQQWEFYGWSSESITRALQQLGEHYEVRIILLEGVRVSFDTDADDSMVGERLVWPALMESGEIISNEPGTFQAIRYNEGGRDLYLFASNTTQSVAASGVGFPAPQLSVVLAAPAADIKGAWSQLLPRLTFAGGLAAVFAVVVTMLLANHITRPIVEMTRASEAMARGEYDQRIAARGNGEIATLARTFNEMAQRVSRSNRAMQQLLANVSHELKTPLTSIQGYSQAMLDGVMNDEDETRRAAQIVHEEAERMRLLVDDLLYLSRIQSAEFSLDLARVDLDTLARVAERRFSREAESANVRIRLELGGGAVVGDERRIEQVAANLIENAIRFTPAGGEVVIRTRSDGAAALLQVWNGGRPIPEADLPYIFDRFHQADTARTDHHAGLGLSIVKELVEAHGGVVTVESSEAAGTTFTVRLPASGPTPRAEAPSAETVAQVRRAP